MNNLFSREDLQIFEPKDLNGKTLKINVIENEDITIIAGQDLKSKKNYVISMNIRCKKVKNSG